MKIQIRNLNSTSTPTLFHQYSMIDSIRDFNLTIEPGKIYGLVGSMGSGGWLLSYFLAGKEELLSECLDMSHSIVTLDDDPVNNEVLKRISCYVGEGVAEFPYRSFKTYPGPLTWKLKKVRSVADQIAEGIKRSGNPLTLGQIAGMFELTGLDKPKRYQGKIHRPLAFNSGERWRASLAIGYAFQKQLYCVPWIEPHGLFYILGQLGRKLLGILRDSGASVIIPVSDEKYIAGLADEIVYLKPCDFTKDDLADENAIKLTE
ncbi:hypothetical protein EV294_105236 [Paenibacillus sp. BK033]|uniref:hypothetical protein n=1 Tax=Paenibacillus sp. BK033 TaxID=2512133 RepID=UPI0010483C20|nr:hypothetical protein [Paenibacillus sp. BK033]TCM96369.1 hypothetical protein EV294_105236 [Paenibacillus sp. BK033]